MVIVATSFAVGQNFQWSECHSYPTCVSITVIQWLLLSRLHFLMLSYNMKCSSIMTEQFRFDLIFQSINSSSCITNEKQKTFQNFWIFVLWPFFLSFFLVIFLLNFFFFCFLYFLSHFHPLYISVILTTNAIFLSTDNVMQSD